MVGISRAGISDNKKWRSLKMNIIFNYQLYLIILIPGLVVYFPLYSNVWCTDCFSQLSGH